MHRVLIIMYSMLMEVVAFATCVRGAVTKDNMIKPYFYCIRDKIGKPVESRNFCTVQA